MRKLAIAAALLLAACGDNGTPGAEGAQSGGSGGSTGDSGGSGGKSPGKGGAPGPGAGGDTLPVDAASPDSGGGVDMLTEDLAPADTAEPAPDTGPSGPKSFCPAGPFEAPRPGASKAICGDFAFKYDWNEGPTWVPAQKAFFFSNFKMRAAGPGDMIKYDPATGKCETFIEGNGCNGLAVDHEGFVLATCHTPRALLRYDLATKKSVVLVDMVEGQKLDSPNDVVVHPNGTVFFTNATFELAGRPPGLGPAILRLDPAGMVHVVIKASVNPLGLSPDGKHLYGAGGVWDVDDAGVPTKKTGGFTLGGDGIAVDCAGNVYTQGGVIVSPQNQTIGHFAGGTNSAFGGEDGKTLIVVNGQTAHVIPMNLPGIP
jgi:gluconolactonase